MELRIFLFFALLGWVASQTDEISYEGLRVDFSALTMNRDILHVLKPAFQRTKDHSFADVREHKSLSSLFIKDIRIIKCGFNEDLFDINTFEFNYPIYTLNGSSGALFFHMSFSYSMTWLGFPVASGKGEADITNGEDDILVFYNESDPDVRIPPPWDVTNVDIPWHLFSPKEWIETILEEKFLLEFDKVLDDSMFDFSHKLFYNYREVNDSFPNETDLVFRNEIIEVKSTVKNTYLSVGFKTNITVDNRYRRKVYRRQLGLVNPKDDFCYCLAAQLIPDTIDLLGKAEIYKETTNWAQWGFENNSVTQLYDIIPNLRDLLDESFTFKISCETSHRESVNDLRTDGKTNFQKYLYPYYCHFIITEQYQIVLMIDVFVHIYYEPISGPEDKVFYGHVRYAELAGFKEEPLLPDARKEVLRPHVEKFCAYFIDKRLASPGIRVFPTRLDELVWKESYMNGNDEICFCYDEKVDGKQSKK